MATDVRHPNMANFSKRFAFLHFYNFPLQKNRLQEFYGEIFFKSSIQSIIFLITLCNYCIYYIRYRGAPQRVVMLDGDWRDFLSISFMGLSHQKPDCWATYDGTHNHNLLFASLQK